MRIALLAKAVAPRIAAARRRMRPRRRASGRRSARQPPSQFPAQRLVIITPISAVQTTSDVPRNGATRREPVSSSTMTAAPQKKEAAWRRFGTRPSPGVPFPV